MFDGPDRFFRPCLRMTIGVVPEKGLVEEVKKLRCGAILFCTDVGQYILPHLLYLRLREGGIEKYVCHQFESLKQVLAEKLG